MQTSLTTMARRLFLDRQAQFWADALGTTWSATEPRARVVDVIDETHDVKTFVLRPNRRWRGHRAGQYTTVTVAIDGVNVQRCYSIASAPGEDRIAVTVKRGRPGGVSSRLHTNVRRGHVLRLGDAAGDFVLPDPAPPRLLLLSGGSGITPVMAILRDLARRDAVRDVVFAHYARCREDVIFGDELSALAARHRGLRLILGLSSEDGRFDAGRLAEQIPDLRERTTFLCGPEGLMARVDEMWKRAGASLTRERFAAPALVAPSAAGSVTVGLARSGRSGAARPSASLLDELERGGERPRHGCRMGICHTCTCRKHHGTVENLITGAVSSAPDEEIQLCVSVARSDVELGL
jgi:ferredoxin-NADP reductase